MKYDLADARLAAAGPNMMPYLARAFMNFHMLPTPELDQMEGCGGMATDCYYRLYYAPSIFDRWTIKECAAVVLHETLHCIMNHAGRAKVKIGEHPSEAQRRVFNIAADCSINSILRDAKIELPKLEGGACFPEAFNLPANLSTEEYYDLLWKQVPKLTVTMGKGGGSSADGQGRAWEHGPPSDGNKTDKDGKSLGGISEAKQDLIARQVAKAMKDYAKGEGRGKMPAGLERWAKQILEPVENPAERLLAECRYAIDSQSGYWHTTYDRPSRRTQRGGPILPRYKQPIPRVTLIVDTSGSMGEDDLAISLGVVSRVIKSLPNQRGVTVITGDTRAETCQRIFRPEQVSLAGGGGTDIGAIMVQAADIKPAPDAIIAITDGDTPWPSHKLGPKCIACITRHNSHHQVPEWITCIQLHPNRESFADGN